MKVSVLFCFWISLLFTQSALSQSPHIQLRLLEAIDENKTEAIKEALDSGASITFKYPLINVNAFNYAAQNGRKKILKIFIERTKNLRTRQNLLDDSLTKVRGKSFEAMYSIFELLFSHGADANTLKDADGKLIPKTTEKKGKTFLHTHNYRNYPKILKLFLTHGYKVNLQEPEGNTVLHLYAYEGFTEGVRVLLGTKRVDTTITNKYGQTALDLARIAGHKEIIALLEYVEKNAFKI